MHDVLQAINSVRVDVLLEHRANEQGVTCDWNTLRSSYCMLGLLFDNAFPALNEGTRQVLCCTQYLQTLAYLHQPFLHLSLDTHHGSDVSVGLEPAMQNGYQLS
jgi:hypothetical protein